MDAYHHGLIMKTYESYVRIQPQGWVVKTRVIAESSQEAYFLLQGQFGNDNIVHLPTEV
jgi:hypothetical protein